MTAVLREGDILGGYRIDALLGRGGMGVVYLTTHERLGRHAAVKVIAPHLAEDPAFRERFERESRLAASLDHPNVVPVYEAGERDGRIFIAMRYVDGTDVRSLLGAEGRLPPDRAVRIVRQIAAALDAAHEQSLVHRDVKPGNVLLLTTPPDHVYLTDFGISTHGTATATTATTNDGIAGSIEYVAPEQILGQRVDGRADVYSLGCMAYELLVGRPPFHRETDAATLGAHVHAPVPAASHAQPGLPSALDEPIRRALAKCPDDRWSTAGLFADALEAAGAEATTPRRLALPRAGAPRLRSRGSARANATTALVSVALAAAAFGVTSHLSRGVASRAPPGSHMFADAFWGLTFRYPAGWGLRSLAPPGIGGAGDGEVGCNVFDDPGARRPADDDALLDFGRRRARQLRRRGGVRLRSLELVHAGAVTGVDVVADDHALGRRTSGHVAEFFGRRGALRVECSAPPSAFAAADQAAFRPLLRSMRVSGRAG